MRALDEGLTRANALDVGHGYVEAKAALVDGWSQGLTWKAGVEAGMRLAPNLTTFAEVYAEPDSMGADAGLRWDW